MHSTTPAPRLSTKGGMFMYGVIYKLTNTLNGKIYIGQTTRSVEQRFKEHSETDSLIGNAIRKYGRENFTIEILAVCDTPEELDAKEIFFIAEYDCKAPNGYNLTDGGEGIAGYSFSAEARANMSAARIGKNSGEDHYLFGKHHSDETRMKMSAAQTGEKNHFFGKHHTEESKAKMAMASLGNTYFLGLHHTMETRSRMSEAKRFDTPYKNFLTAMTERQLSYNALAKMMGISQAALSMKLRDERKFTAKDIAELVAIFELPAEYLLARDDGLLVVTASRGGENNPFFGRHHDGGTRIELSAANRGDTPYQNLRNEMDKRQITYRNLARLLGLSQVNISRKMSGVRNFTAKDIAELVEIFELPAEYLLARYD